MSFSNSQLPLNIKIGRYCSIGPGVNVASYNHPYKCLSTSIFSHDKTTDLTIRSIRDFLPDGEKFNFVSNPQKKGVVIKHDVWVGQNVTFLPGITLATGSVVAANSVVTKDTEPYSIVGGNPAKIIKYRFEKWTIKKLLESEWWLYNYVDFHGLDISNTEQFLNQFEKKVIQIKVFQPKEIKISECPT